MFGSHSSARKGNFLQYFWDSNILEQCLLNEIYNEVTRKKNIVDFW